MRHADWTHPAMPIWALLLLVLACCLGGCATSPDPATSAEAESLLGQPPDGAFYRNGQLVLAYRVDQETAFLTATWPVDELEPDRHNYRMSVIDLASEAPASLATLQKDWQPVRLLDNTHWKALISKLWAELAPGSPGHGTLVTVQGTDFVLYRDAGGALHTARLETKPAGVEVGQRIGEADFAARANARLQAELSHDGQAEGPVLFAVGEDDLGGAFVLFDFASRQSVFIAQPPSPLPPDQAVGFSLRLLETLTFRSHLFTALGHPFTMASRLLWLTTHTSAVLLPRGLPGGESAVAPLLDHPPMDTAQWEQQLDQLVGRDRYRGSMKPLIDGEAFFVALVQGIQSAQESVDIRLYIFDSDDYALRIADLLKRRSREIRVRVLVDRLGTLAAGQVPARSPFYSRRKPPLSIADYLRQDSEIEVRYLNNPWLTSDHTKVIVVDGRQAFLGGMNIGREYRYEWHDLMVEAAGPIVGRLHKDFEKRWAYAGLGGDLAFAAASLKPERHAGEAERPDFMDIRPLYTRTGDAQILRAQLAAIRQARRRIYIEQPYVSDDEVIAELIQARRRGVDVRVVFPTRSDSGFMNSANLLAARAFLNHGVRVYGFPGMTHVKAALYDNWACVGSANFDKLSLRINQETNLATSDPRFVDQIERDLFEADFARSREWAETRPVGWSDYIAEFIADQL